MGAVIGAVFGIISTTVVCYDNHKRRHCPVDMHCKFTWRTCHGSWIATTVVTALGGLAGYLFVSL